MSEYIEREAIRNVLYEADAITLNGVAIINKFPSADVAPVVHGEWKYYHKQNKAVCTNCSFERDLDADFGAAIDCPNCGAKMDGGEKHE